MLAVAIAACAILASWWSVRSLSDRQAEQFMADLWDWYCGELDHEITGYAASLRPASFQAARSAGQGIRVPP